MTSSHHAITTSYTQLLDWFLPEEPTDGDEHLPPVIGLTATPFRGTKNEEETRWLANRFGRTVLPSAAKQPELYERLRRDGILSTVEAKPLPYDVPFTFTEEELDHFRRFNEFPDSALRRLADDQDRNKLIVDRVRKAVDDGPVLLFANSVEHAQHLTARLCLTGVPSASIYADTDVAVHRCFITNSSKAGYRSSPITWCSRPASTRRRPRRSSYPVRYSARCATCKWSGADCAGPKNGGTESCTIITVVDNLVQYGDRLAYHYFMRHYS